MESIFRNKVSVSIAFGIAEVALMLFARQHNTHASLLAYPITVLMFIVQGVLVTVGAYLCLVIKERQSKAK